MFDNKRIGFDQAREIIKELDKFGFTDALNKNDITISFTSEYYHNRYNLLNFFYKNGDKFPDDLHWTAGTCRIVVWSDNLEYVIKINIYQSETWYNTNEVFMYKKAYELGYEDGFAWADYFCNVNNHVIMVMEKCDVDYDAMSDHMYDSGYDTEEEGDMINFLEEEDCFWRHNSNEVFDLLDDFHVGDIHPGNIGYNSNYNLVLVDYAGYMNGDIRKI